MPQNSTSQYLTFHTRGALPTSHNVYTQCRDALRRIPSLYNSLLLMYNLDREGRGICEQIRDPKCIVREASSDH